MPLKKETKSKPSNVGPMDKFVTGTTNQSGESSQTPTVAEPCVKLETSPEFVSPLNQLQQGSAPVPHHPPDPQEEESHMNHTFEWCCPGMNPTTFTCNKPGPIEDRLMTSPQFRANAKKNNNKELVILLEGRAISSHFPCCLILNKRLTVKYIKKMNKHKQPVFVRPKIKMPPSKLVVFNLLTKGGKNVANITKNPALKNDFEEMSIYGYEGEKVKQALRRDGRLQSSVLEKKCLLSRKNDEVTTEMSGLIDDLDGKTFKLIRCKKSSPLESLPSSLEDAYIEENESVRSPISESNGSQVPPQQSANDDTPKEKPKQNDSQASENMWREMPNSKTMQKRLSEQFDHLVKGKKTEQGSKLSRIQNLFRAEFGKNAQTCREVKTMKKLMDLSNSVCQVRINGGGAGSGFLLFGRFVLTNCHVLRSIANESSGQHHVTVHFSFESLGQVEVGVRMEEVAGFEYSEDESGHMYDWALLKLSADQNLPDALLNHFGFLPQSGGICIIGHPAGGVKKIDPCLIIPTEKRLQVVEKQRLKNPGGVLVDGGDFGGNQGELYLLTDQFFGHVVNSVEHNRQALTYGTCFYFGSSGSPVFDEHCKVVAMHTGGFHYGNARGEHQSVLEFGYPLSAIIEHIIIQGVERERLDMLKEYLACCYAGHQTMMTNVKKLVESRNNTAFKYAVIKSLARNDLDESLKKLFHFFNQNEEPVPMEIDRAWKNI